MSGRRGSDRSNTRGDGDSSFYSVLVFGDRAYSGAMAFLCQRLIKCVTHLGKHRSLVVAVVANDVACHEQKLHGHSHGGVYEDVVEDPETCAHDHQLSEPFVVFAEGSGGLQERACTAYEADDASESDCGACHGTQGKDHHDFFEVVKMLVKKRMVARQRRMAAVIWPKSTKCAEIRVQEHERQATIFFRSLN